MSSISEEVAKRAKDKRISCKEALAIAEELKVSPAEVGKEINAQGIKIKACQLGCF